MDVVVWCALTGGGAGRELEVPDVGFVGPSVVLLERLEIEGLVASCCRNCDFVGELPEVELWFLLDVVPVRGVVVELVVVEKAA